MKNGFDMGQISELMITAKFMERGETVLKPISNLLPYDLLIDHGNSVVRIQCKTAHIRGNCIKCKCEGNNSRRRQRYVGKIDAFAFYCVENKKTYVVPIHIIGNRCGIRLRLAPTKNKQIKKVIMASDFEYN